MKVVKIDELIYLSNQYTDFSCKPSYKKYKEGTIFDEEKSVRWNREEVDRKNNLRQEEVKRLNREKNQMYEKLVNLIYQYIHPVYGEHYLKNGYLEKRYYYGTEK